MLELPTSSSANHIRQEISLGAGAGGGYSYGWPGDWSG